MKIPTIICCIAVLGFLQGCEKAREALQEKAEQARSSMRAKSAASNGSPYETELASEREFGSFTEDPDGLRVVAFYSDRCPPCRRLAPVMNQIAKDFEGRIHLAGVDVDGAGALAQKSGVSSIPDVRMYRGGKQVHRFAGAPPPEDVRALFQQYAAGIGSPGEDGETGEAEAKVAPIRPMEKDWIPPGMQRR